MDPLIDFFINVILLIIFFITFISQASLLYKSTLMIGNQKLPAQILNNMTYWVLVSFLGAIQSGYKCLYPLEKRNIFFLYTIGVPFGGLTAPISLSVTFLLLDRIFVFVYPIAYRKYRKTFISVNVISCICMTIFIILSLYFNVNPFRARTPECRKCDAYSSYFMFVTIRVILGFSNLVLGIIMVVVLHRYTAQNHNSQFKKANTLTIIASLIELFCNFVPNFCIFVGYWLSLVMSELVFTYPMFMIGIDAILTAIIYRFVINSKRRSIKVVSNTTRVMFFAGIPAGLVPRPASAKESTTNRY